MAATHRDLDAMVASGAFREDLYYRLRGMVLRTPPLAERPDDVPLLAARFLRQAAPRARLTADALAWLSGRDWPGNVRELRAADGDRRRTGPTWRHYGGRRPAALRRRARTRGRQPHRDAPARPGCLDAAVAELETRMLRETMAATGGNQSEAARRLGLSRMGLIKKLARLGLREAAKSGQERDPPS